MENLDRVKRINSMMQWLAIRRVRLELMTSRHPVGFHADRGLSLEDYVGWVLKFGSWGEKLQAADRVEMVAFGESVLPQPMDVGVRDEHGSLWVAVDLLVTKEPLHSRHPKSVDQVITVLRKMGLVDQSGLPTSQAYREGMVRRNELWNRKRFYDRLKKLDKKLTVPILSRTKRDGW